MENIQHIEITQELIDGCDNHDPNTWALATALSLSGYFEPSVGVGDCVIQTSRNIPESRNSYIFNDNLKQWMHTVMYENPRAKPATVVLDHKNKILDIQEV